MELSIKTDEKIIYGDGVADYTPSVFRRFGWNISTLTMEEASEKYCENKWIILNEPGKQEQEYCEFDNVEIWSDKGWTNVNRIVRHKLASNKRRET